MAGFRRYTPPLTDDLIHRLYLLKERTGISMAEHMRQAVRLYLQVQDELHQAGKIDHQKQGELILARLREALRRTA